MKLTQLIAVLLIVLALVVYTQASSPGSWKTRYIGEQNVDELADELMDILADKKAYEVKPNNAGKYHADEIYRHRKIYRSEAVEELADQLWEILADKIAYEIKGNNAGKYNPDRPVL